MQADKEVKQWQELAQDVKFQTDPIIHWVSCYEKLVLKFDEMQADIKAEFSNYI